VIDLSAEDSLDHSISNAAKHYSSLFFLPTLRKTIVALGGLCIAGIGISAGLYFRSWGGFLTGLLLGAVVFAFNLFFDQVVSRGILKEPIFVPRRMVVLSLFSWILWLPLVLTGALLGFFYNLTSWINLCMLGFASVFTMRVIVLRASSSTNQFRSAVASLIQPLSCVLPFVVFWAYLGVPTVSLLPFLVVSILVGYAFGFSFVFQLDRLGRKLYGLPALPLFRAFMLNWVAGLNGPFEEYLEKLGEKEDIEVSFLRFDSSQSKSVKAAVIVPSVHPGPFKNIGSSLLPSLLKERFENFHKCVACVPLGILGHELDLASQTQNKRIIDAVIASANKVGNSDKCLPSVKVTDDNATVYCQVFGSTVLLSFTFAPKTTEDLPQELGHVVREEALKRGLKCAVVINAHNSIDDTVADLQSNSLEKLRNLAIEGIEKALSATYAPFEVGASTVFPKDFTLKSGMGTGGITAVVFSVAGQKTVYIVIDGNNMISGLREKILSALSSEGFDHSEVFTTDTHAVSAVVLGRRGYNPVGEAMDHATLIRYIVGVAKTAEANLEKCTSIGQSISIPDITVIGETRLNSLSLLVDSALRRAKRMVIPFFGIEALLLILLVILL